MKYLGTTKTSFPFHGFQLTGITFKFFKRLSLRWKKLKAGTLDSLFAPESRGIISLQISRGKGKIVTGKQAAVCRTPFLIDLDLDFRWDIGRSGRVHFKTRSFPKLHLGLRGLRSTYIESSTKITVRQGMVIPYASVPVARTTCSRTEDDTGVVRGALEKELACSDLCFIVQS